MGRRTWQDARTILGTESTTDRPARQAQAAPANRHPPPPNHHNAASPTSTSTTAYYIIRSRMMTSTPACTRGHKRSGDAFPPSQPRQRRRHQRERKNGKKKECVGVIEKEHRGSVGEGKQPRRCCAGRPSLRHCLHSSYASTRAQRASHGAASGALSFPAPPPWLRYIQRRIRRDRCHGCFCLARGCTRQKRREAVVRRTSPRRRPGPGRRSQGR